MKQRQRILAFLLLLLLLSLLSCSSADFLFSDDRFRGRLTTDNLDAIIEEYELYDGWYWTTQAEVSQNFHGHQECPGWTTSVEASKRKEYLKGWYGCRWPIDHVRRVAPDRGGYAECFAFTQFIGYLLSGDINPHKNWDLYYKTEKSGPLQVGDIVQVDYKKRGRYIHHSAVVYSVTDDQILFLQVSGSRYNRISVGSGFTDGNVVDATSFSDISSFQGLSIFRYHTVTE